MMRLARFVLRMCRRQELKGRRQINTMVYGPIPVYSGWDVMNRKGHIS